MQFKLFILCFCIIHLATFQVKALALTTDTVTVSPIKKTQVQLLNNEIPIILRKGETLVVKVAETEKIKTTVRVHSSLGKLVKEFIEVENQISMITDKLPTGVYLIIIKQADKREIRKFLLTE